MFALSGSEQNPGITEGNWKLMLRSRLRCQAPPPVEAFKSRGADVVQAHTLHDLVAGLNNITGNATLNYEDIERRDIHKARRHLDDKLFRAAKPEKFTGHPAGRSVAQ